MSGQLGELETMRGQKAKNFFTISFAFGGAFQVEEACVPGWDLHALVAQTAGPARDIFQIVKRSGIAGELGQKECRAFDRFHRGQAPLKLNENIGWQKHSVRCPFRGWGKGNQGGEEACKKLVPKSASANMASDQPVAKVCQLFCVTTRVCCWGW